MHLCDCLIHPPHLCQRCCKLIVTIGEARVHLNRFLQVLVALLSFSVSEQRHPQGRLRLCIGRIERERFPIAGNIHFDHGPVQIAGFRQRRREVAKPFRLFGFKIACLAKLLHGFWLLVAGP